MLSNQEKVFTKKAASAFGLRVDGRDCLALRPLSVRAGCFPGAAGSAAVGVGGGSLVTVRVDVALGQLSDEPVSCTLVAPSLSATVNAVVRRALSSLAASLSAEAAPGAPPLALTVTVAHPDADPPVNAVGVSLWVALRNTRIPHMSEEMTRERDGDGGRTVARVVVSPAVADSVPLVPDSVEVPLILSVHRIDGMLMLDATETEIACADAGLLLALLPASGTVVATQTLAPTTLRLAEVQTAVSHARSATASLAPAIIEAQRSAVGGGQTPDYLLTVEH
jgi:exosome complex RNA-binding protein Rrp42 (RNase PH superfamily)